MQIPELFNILRECPIFSFLEDELLYEIENKFILKSFSHGENILLSNDEKTGYYIIYSGTVQVISNQNNQNKRLATLRKGDSFGEQSIIYDENKITDIYLANSDLVVAFLPKIEFKNIIEKKDGFQNFISNYVANYALQVFLKNFGSFGGLTPKESAKWINNLTFEEPKENDEIIFQEGDEGDKFYIVTSGAVNISKVINGQNTLLVTLGEGKFFGEMALVSNAPRAATVKSVGKTNLISMDKSKFIEMLESNPILSAKIQNIVDMYKASSIPKDAFIQKSKDYDEYKISSEDIKQNSENKKNELPFEYEMAFSPITAAVSTLNIISTYYNKDFDKNVGLELVQSDRLSEVNSLLNDVLHLNSNVLKVKPNDLKRLRLPFITKIDEKLCVVYEKNENKYKIASPQSGLSELDYEELNNILDIVIVTQRPIREEFDNQKLTFLSFIGILIPYKKILIEILIASLFISILSLMPPIFVRILIDDVIVNKNEDMLSIIIFALIAVAIFMGILISLRAYLQFYLEGKLQVAILGRFYRHLISLPMEFFIKKHSGDILADFEDGKDAEKFFAKMTLTILVDGTTAIALLSAMAIANLKLFFIFFCFILVMGSIIFAYTYYIRQYTPKTLSRDTKTDASMLESIKNINVIKAFCGENYYRNHWERMYINKLSNLNKYIMINTVSSSAVMAMRTLTLAVLLGYGSMMALANEISIGEALAINMVAMLALVPLGKLIELYNDINTALFFASGLNKVYSIEQEWNKKEQKKPNLNLTTADIVFNNVSFSYSKDSKKILDNFSLFIPNKKYTAIVGRIGSGKSSIVNLLARMVEVNSGEILIDNQNISQINLKSLRSNIGIVFQEPNLFAGTIKENIGFGKQGSSIAQIIEAATLVGAHEFIINMSNGYDTVLGENGTGLSGGQKRLIAVARALVSNPSILIMDEPTNDFDTETEQIFKENLKTIAYGRTLIIITHRPTLIRDADQIALIDEGKIIETGVHAELITRKGYYFYLSAKQLTLS